MADDMQIDFGIDESSLARLRDLEGRFASLDGPLRVTTMAEVGRLAEQLKENLRQQFIDAGHDRSGDPNADPNHVHTIDTLDVEIDGFNATVSMGGGAPYIFWGTTEHFVAPVEAEALHWIGPGGEDFFSKGHEVSGIEADQEWAQKAIADADLPGTVRRIFSMARAQITGNRDEAINLLEETA